MVGKEENRARHLEWGRGGMEALSSVGSPGRPQLLLLCTIARLGGRVKGWFGKGAEAEYGGSLYMLPGREIPGEKNAADARGSASEPRETQHLGDTRAQARQKCPNRSPLPSLCAQSLGG